MCGPFGRNLRVHGPVISRSFWVAYPNTFQQILQACLLAIFELDPTAQPDLRLAAPYVLAPSRYRQVLGSLRRRLCLAGHYRGVFCRRRNYGAFSFCPARFWRTRR